MKKKKKFFFAKEDNVQDLLGKIDEKQMSSIVGGLETYSREAPPTQYAESTYVRKS